MEALPIRTNANLLNGLPPGTPAPLGADDEAKISFRIVLGSYERFLYGIDAVFSESDESNEDGNSSSEQKLPTLRLHPRFIHPAHTSSIKSLALHPSGLLASGSTDETIRLHSLPRKKELGTLEAQRGTITSLSFTGAHLVSAAEDGTVGVYRKKDWEEVKTISSGKKEVAIRDLAVHPSGRLALGVCSDGYLRLYDLTAGRLSTSTHLPLPPNGLKKHTSATLPDRILFSPDGSRYLLLSHLCVEIRELVGEKGKRTLLPPKHGKFTSAAFLPDSSVVAGLESGDLLHYSPTSDEPASKLSDHKGRVRLLETLLLQHPTKEEETISLLATAASSGVLHIYLLPLTTDSKPIATYDARFRPTCIVMGSTAKKQVRVPVVEVEEAVSKRAEKRKVWEEKAKSRVGTTAPEKDSDSEEEEEADSDDGSEVSPEPEIEEQSSDSESESDSDLPRPPPRKKGKGRFTVEDVKLPVGMPRKPGPAVDSDSVDVGSENVGTRKDGGGRGGKGGQVKGRMTVRR